MASAVALICPGGRVQLDRRTIEALAELFVGLLDITEPDSDMEETDSEDSFVLSWHASGGSAAGCPVADPGGCEHDGREPTEGY